MLNHIMNLASENALKQFEVLDKVTVNIANVNTSAYKGVRFEQYLRPDGMLAGTNRTDYSKGSIMTTNRDLDIAIDGHGFLPVTQPDGTVAYTRDGSLALNSQGYLVTHRGDLVGDGIKVPTNYDKLLFQKDGTIQVRLKGEMVPQTLGKLTLSRFINPEGLKNIGHNKVVPTTESGEATTDTDSVIKQGSLERANVNVYHQIDQVLRLNASVISNLRIVKFSDDLYRQAVNLKQ